MSTSPPEQRLAQFVRLNASALKKYKEMHANVWPEVLQSIRECNICDCMFFAGRKNKIVSPNG